METRRDPLNYKTAILTQWAQVALMGIIYVVIPESPCECGLAFTRLYTHLFLGWFVKKGMKEKGMKTLNRLYGKISGYDAEEEYEILAATIKAEEAWALANKEIAWQAIFRGVNGVSLFSLFPCRADCEQWRTLISAWSLTAISFVGQSFLSKYVLITPAMMS
jgi:hypothetical protein